MECLNIFLLIMGLSFHYPDADAFNGVNPGAGLEFDCHNVYASVGAYHNSYERLSVYGFVGAETEITEWVSVGAEGGIISGYEIPVAIAPYVSVGHDNYNVKVFVLPPSPDGDTSGVVALQLKLHSGFFVP